MVLREYVECPLCGKLYQLKIQADQNVGIFEWPISFVCKDCGEIMNYTYSPQGLRPRGVGYHPSPTDEPITTIGYSSSLPIVESMYMQDMDYQASIALFSPYISLQLGYFTLSEIHEFDLFLRTMQSDLLPYRTFISELLPVLLKGNVKAFGKKMNLLFKEKKYLRISTPLEMYDAFFEQLEKFYVLLSPNYYINTVSKSYFYPLLDIVDKATNGETKSIKNKLDESGRISEWYKDEALPYVAESLKNVQKIIPAMIYLSAGVSNTQQRGDLKILSISCDEATAIYKEGYETLIHGLKIIVGVNNIVENGNIDTFTNPKYAYVDSITKFAELNGGKMIEQLEDYNSINAFLDSTINNKVRNAASHGKGGVKYDALTQKVKCYYDDKDQAKVYETTLIDICRLCHVQMLHIIEAIVLAHRIVEKAK